MPPGNPVRFTPNWVERLLGAAEGMAGRGDALRGNSRSFMGVLCLAASMD
jgi:hypothetical protein